jgi:hypothetical protein
VPGALRESTGDRGRKHGWRESNHLKHEDTSVLPPGISRLSLLDLGVGVAEVRVERLALPTPLRARSRSQQVAPHRHGDLAMLVPARMLKSHLFAEILQRELLHRLPSLRLRWANHLIHQEKVTAVTQRALDSLSRLCVTDAGESEQEEAESLTEGDGW